MRIVPVIGLCLLLIGCARSDHGSARSDDPGVPMGTSETMREVMGEPVQVAPLLPQPGDVWSGVTGKPVNPPRRAQAFGPTPAEAPAMAAAMPAPPALPEAQHRPEQHRAARDDDTYYAQLAAAGSEKAAQTEWNRLRLLVPDLLGGKAPVVSPAHVDGRLFWRLRTGFASRVEAATFCARLKQERLPCWVTSGQS